MTKTSQPPLGKKENERLEFKSRDVLRNRESIARGVVAFLNTSQGGSLWIGVGETDGVASAIEPVAHAEQEAGALFDYLVDAIEPPPEGRDVVIRSVPVTQGNVMCIDVRGGRMRPYAVRRGVARSYVVRVGARVRALTAEEIAKFFSERARPGRVRSSHVADELQAAQKTGAPELWIALEPEPPLKVDDDAVPRVRLERLLRDPTETGNRSMGWNLTSSYSRVTPAQGERRFGGPDDYHRTIVRDTGTIVFRAPLARLARLQGPSDEIFPYALCEYPASVCRFARQLFRETTTPVDDRSIFATLALLGVRGWKLRPHSPRSVGFEMAEPHVYDELDHIVVGPLAASWDALDGAPDRIAMRLVADVYRAFNHWDEALPAEYDRRAGVLALPA